MANSVLAKMAVEITANTAQFNRGLAQANNSLKGIQSATNFASSALAAFGVTLGVAGVARALQNVVGIMASFEASMSEVKAITGATGDQFKALEADAKRLGSSTKFTATEVSKLQVAYGRLGFSTKEILAATGATLDLAAATGEDLAKSADVAGSTVRGFDLDAKETIRVVDVMASSFNKSALSLDNFTESMKYVAPIANAAGASVEETTALLATLADSGVRGSQAGTSLRRIFTDLTKDGRPLRDRLKELGDKGITLSDSFDEVGRVAQTALLILSKNTDKTNALANAFNNAAGEAEKMARVMQDNLTGDVIKLTSAWEGLVLAVTGSNFFRSQTQDLTALLNALSGTSSLDPILKRFSKDIKGFSDPFKEGSPAFQVYVDQFAKVRKELGRPIDLRIAEEIGNRYELSSQQVGLLEQALKQANKSLSFQEDAIKQFNAFTKRNGYEDLVKGADDYIKKLGELIIFEKNKAQRLRQVQIDTGDDDVFSSLIAAAEEQAAAYERTSKIVQEYAASSVEASKSINKEATITLGLIDAIQEKIKSETERNKTILDPNELAKSNNELIKLNNELQRLKNLGKVDVKELIKFTPPKDIEVDVIFGASVQEQFALLKAALSEIGGAFIKVEGEATNAFTKIEEGIEAAAGQILDVGPLIAGGIADIANALGEAAFGGEDFGKAFIKSLARFAQQFGALLIAAGVGKQALQSGDPKLMIAGGAALIAAGAAISQLMSKKPSLSGGGSGGGVTRGGGYSGGGVSGTTQNPYSQLYTSVSGTDLNLVIANTNKKDNFTKPTWQRS